MDAKGAIELFDAGQFRAALDELEPMNSGKAEEPASPEDEAPAEAPAETEKPKAAKPDPKPADENHCSGADCGASIGMAVKVFSKSKYGQPLCMECQQNATPIDAG
jgi:hypothetical protein